MTHRDELNALSNADFGTYLMGLVLAVDPCRACPARKMNCINKEHYNSNWSGKNCAETIADWLRSEA